MLLYIIFICALWVTMTSLHLIRHKAVNIAREINILDMLVTIKFVDCWDLRFSCRWLWRYGYGILVWWNKKMEIVGSPARMALIYEPTRHRIIYCYFYCIMGDKGYTGPRRIHYCFTDRKFDSGARSWFSPKIDWSDGQKKQVVGVLKKQIRSFRILNTGYLWARHLPFHCIPIDVISL
jgi:hypothetical protein